MGASATYNDALKVYLTVGELLVDFVKEETEVVVSDSHLGVAFTQSSPSDSRRIKPPLILASSRFCSQKKKKNWETTMNKIWIKSIFFSKKLVD